MIIERTLDLPKMEQEWSLDLPESLYNNGPLANLKDFTIVVPGPTWKIEEGLELHTWSLDQCCYYWWHVFYVDGQGGDRIQGPPLLLLRGVYLNTIKHLIFKFMNEICLTESFSCLIYRVSDFILDRFLLQIAIDETNQKINHLKKLYEANMKICMQKILDF